LRWFSAAAQSRQGSVFPVITGKTGRERIYDGYPDVALDMVASRTFDDSIQQLEYVPRVLAGPPDAQPDS